MARAYTQHWNQASWKNAAEQSAGEVQEHTAGSEFRKRGVKPGDTIFVVTNIDGKMYLAGRMRVAHIFDSKNEAAKYLQCDPSGLWPAPEHCVCRPKNGSTLEFDRLVPDKITQALLFDQSGKPKSLTFDSPGVLRQQTLRGVKRLTPASADLLHQLIDADHNPELVDKGDTYEAEEWRSQLVIHLRHERDRRIVQLKRASTSTLVCECCGFDFGKEYGKWGAGIIECHHRKPLSEIRSGQKTRVEDLALVCANCHRVLHRSTSVLSVERLREIIRQRRSGHARKL